MNKNMDYRKYIDEIKQNRALTTKTKIMLISSLK